MLGPAGQWIDRSDPEEDAWEDSRSAFPDEGHLGAAERLVRPGWLLRGWEPSITGRDEAGIHVSFARRPAAGLPARSDPDAEITELTAVVDPERGVVVRLAEFMDGELCRTTELVGLGESADPQEEPADDITLDFDVPEPLRLAARRVDAALGGAVRLGSRLVPAPEPEPDDEPWFDETGPQEAEEGHAAGLPGLDDVVPRLHQGTRGGPEFSARVESWQDVKALSARFASLRAKAGGLFGGEQTWAAFDDVSPDRTHTTSRIVFADLVRYRVEAVRTANARQPRITACDGTTRYRRHPDKLVTSPAAPPEFGLARMFDPSWLIASGAELTVHGWTESHGRRALRLTATAPRETTEAAFAFRHVEVLLDDELGVLLRLTAYDGTDDDGSGDAAGPAVARVELRDVRVGAAAPAGFRLAPPPNGRIVEDTGGPLGDSALPPPLKAAAEVASVVAGGAALLTGLLGRKRDQNHESGKPDGRE